MRLSDKVAGGACLSDAELQLMEQSLDRARGLMPGSTAFPEYDRLFARCIDICGEIAQTALHNELGGH